MSKSVKIKEIIETLCQLFYSHGYPKIQAEALRQAKFNQKEAVLPLLEFISCILVQDIKQDLNELSPLQKFKLILSILTRLDYPRLKRLSCDKLCLLSSQELLLAFGYILKQLDVFGHLRHAADTFIVDKLLKN